MSTEENSVKKSFTDYRLRRRKNVFLCYMVLLSCANADGFI